MNNTGKKFGGRAKGTKNRTPSETKDAIQKLIAEELKYFTLYLDTLKPKERLEIIVKLLPFAVAKMSHLELDTPLTSYNFTLVTIIANEPIKIQKDEAETEN